ncbi:UDP-N-acetylglucosamine transferase subunit ALG14 [Paenibacillus polysaccharolyticus]|uniref:PssD/Cps14F family polysaccharide biosynthesis glycosyltransferase n=1 Tax=Paenibacillus polysaccharolyticus TaxID=582692 RepID=UPI00203EB83D|nr:PssD/Cps14F family polysaccharide biosynthesis glycosyltransferase [Paenibacillus polysaccharolyticus]MCM3135334.1 UDP-N-acetylglucosamine transferase subunit ALG14 [Paenibacillus polysaccharolyticus]
MKVCLISSTGGHLDELTKIIPAVEDHDYFIITEKNKSKSVDTSRNKVYFLMQQERKNLLFLLVFAANIIKSLYLYLRERPKVIITTGAGATFPFCLFGKLFGAKLIYIESYAKIYSSSATGRLMYKISDEFFIQWETLQDSYPNAKYRGALF